MARYPGSDVLRRLSDHRGLDIGLFSQQSGRREPEPQAVFNDELPSPALLRRLAPVLGLRAADLFVITGMPVPEDLAPLDPTAGSLVPSLVQHVVFLPPHRRGQVRRYARSLPQERRTPPVRAPRAYEQYPPGIGGVLLGMLANRNLGWTSSAKVFAVLTGLYVSAATIGGVGRGRVEVTRDLLDDFAVVLGIPADDLAAVAGPVGQNGKLPARLHQQHSAGPDMAGLIRELTRLSADQVRRVGIEAGVKPR